MGQTNPDSRAPLLISEWKAAQISGNGLQRLCSLVEAEQSANSHTHAWISLADTGQIEEQWTKLKRLGPQASSLPLYGVPFAIKDNIDAEGFATTAACPSFASGKAASDAAVVRSFKSAGAILIGKTNLDQFATGLVGTRSPYGAVPNSFDSTRVSGGSSSGSAVVVARGVVPFSLGTDTAGSGRVPAGFNNIVGLKPTRGALSTAGVVPACRTLDCVSIFALTVEDAQLVLSVVEGYDPEDSYSRKRPDLFHEQGDTVFGHVGSVSSPRLAICSSPNWFGCDGHHPAYDKALEKAASLGWVLEPVDFSPLFQLAQLLYSGTWVAERYEAIRSFIQTVEPQAMDPVVRKIIKGAEMFTAADSFAGEYLRRDLTRQIEAAFARFDGILVPTTPTFPTLEQLSLEPVEENSKLGTYTNFVNFMDRSALSFPAGFRPDGLPFGLTLIANAWQEPQLLELAHRFCCSAGPRTLGATRECVTEGSLPNSVSRIAHDIIPIAVVGAHLTGFPLNKDLTSRNATFSKQTSTSSRYRLFALSSTSGVSKPGLKRISTDQRGKEIEVEIWNLPNSALASFMQTIPSPLSIGKIELQDRSWVHGFVCEPIGLECATDITDFGGWRSYSKYVQVPIQRSEAPSKKKTISKVLVANRGEIAARIIKTLHKMGLQAVAIYSSSDYASPHARTADVALELKGQTVSETYLNINQIIELAKASEVDSIIPGYGFLSENADFARAVQDAGMVWIGPTPKQMHDLGLKHKAREIACAADVPTVPGSQGLLSSLDDALREAQQVGFPLMLKSTAGGGGIGLSHCEDEESLAAAFDGVARQSQANFGNGGLFLERFITQARHVEIQILGDGTGRAMALGERDCSLQRRHQKVVEESPAVMVPQDVRNKMKAAALRLASSVKYLNVGTVEFVYDINSADFFFLEVNTRLQVEHPVTEQVTGLDLVECMIKTADSRWDELSPESEQDVALTGASIEVRIYAESPLQNFRPSAGEITELIFPDNLRIDTWVEQGTRVTTAYDPMIAKVISHGADRKEALEKLLKGLENTKIEGLQTNLEYLRQILASGLLQSGNYTTKSLDTFRFLSFSFEILDPGTLTTVQDYPGRTGYFNVGIPPSGPMDSYSFRLANRLVKNPVTAAGLECTLQGPTLKFHQESIVAVTGGVVTVTLDGSMVAVSKAIKVQPGQVLRVGDIEHGYRVYIGIRGGIDVVAVMGSRSTFEIGKLGGFHGRKLRAHDIIPIFPSNTSDVDTSNQITRPFPIPHQPNAEWLLRVIPGPHGAPDYFTEDSVKRLFSEGWKVHHNSNRLGVRLKGPYPEWARSSGGEAGLHSSNIHDSPYSVGSVSFTGDEAVILTCDGPSLGGFVVFCVIASADMWKIGQSRPGDTIRFKPVTPEVAMGLDKELDRAIEELRGLDDINTIPDTVLSQSLSTEPIIVVSDKSQNIQARQAGDRAILLDFGDFMGFDMRQSFEIFAFCDQHSKIPIPGVEELTPGVFTLHVQYSQGIFPSTIIDRITQHVKSYSVPTQVPSRIFRMPLAFDDGVCRAAIKRYGNTIRQQAPWLPSNTKFLAELNGLDTVANLLYEASFLVLGLGDVFMGSPCAVPIDPRHRLFGSKYNPSRSFTPRGAVGIGGQYMCIYATDSPGGYQLVGRTKEIWDHDCASICSGRAGLIDHGAGSPWLFRLFDRITFYTVTEEELDSKSFSDLVHVEESVLDLTEYESWLDKNKLDIESRKAHQAHVISNSPFVEELIRPYLQANSTNSGKENPEIGTDTIPGEWIQAMMPGRCYKINVKEGDMVNEGDILLCIESSKMELEIKSQEDGRCVAVGLVVGDIISISDNLVKIERLD
ncbi:unnamed protein product [Clonostachys chloroleuca]|uniref:Urea amidolyase n=1 Tax=Clonostachys chloroleuca TaxID=1926264 RepID=A0AA35M5Y8_9HYPO|nr:unnamed protein product [Clonostachys chloroleuca]